MIERGQTASVGAALALILPSLAFSQESPLVTVGSKQFTESVILGEIATQLLESEGIRVQHQAQLG
ncbi:MAG: hypothetical protein L0Z53_00215, partial [Acidobacteriales bacterium]|nr:hypothetical protein [Terriglobales bacterium]